MLNSAAEIRTVLPKLASNTWIGLHRDAKEKSRWLWVDGSLATFTNWNRGEPNNLNEHCGMIYRVSGKWNDAYCSSRIKYICEISGKLKNF